MRRVVSIIELDLAACCVRETVYTDLDADRVVNLIRAAEAVEAPHPHAITTKERHV